MPDHDSGVFAPEQLAGFGSLGANIYNVQDARVPHLTASHTAPFDSRFYGNRNPHQPHQISDVHTERQHGHVFAVGDVVHHLQEGYSQFSYNAAIPVQSPTLAREAPLRGAPAADLPLARPTPYPTHYQGPAPYPGEITYDSFTVTYSVDRAPAASPPSEWDFGSTESASGHSIRGHGSPTNGLSPYVFAQGTIIQQPSVSYLEVDPSAGILCISSA